MIIGEQNDGEKKDEKEITGYLSSLAGVVDQSRETLGLEEAHALHGRRFWRNMAFVYYRRGRR